MNKSITSASNSKCWNHLLLNAIVFTFGVSIGYMICSLMSIDSFNRCHVSDAPTEESSTTNNTTKSSSSTSLFDQMHYHLFQIANKPVLTTNYGRRRYKLGDVPATGGGLDNSDRELLAKLYYNASSVFEFGLGESTHIAAYVGLPRYSGVDTDATWVGQAREDAKEMNHFKFSFADIGSTRLFGNPDDESLQKIPYALQSAPLNNEMEAYDVYLVDGRYRVACACACFLHAWDRGGIMESIRVGVHDWSRGKIGVGNVSIDWGWGYWSLLEIADVEYRSKELAILKLKTNTTKQDILTMWEKHMWDRR